MIPVYQDRFGSEDGKQRGNCLAACVASIWEEPLDNLNWLDGYAENVAAWTRTARPAFMFCDVDRGFNYTIAEGYPDVEGVGTGRWRYDVRPYWRPPENAEPEGYWIASVWSQRLMRPVEDPYHGMPALHAVVMQGRRLVHDPNPKNEPYRADENGDYAGAVVFIKWWERVLRTRRPRGRDRTAPRGSL